MTDKPRIPEGHPLAPPKPGGLDRAHSAAGGVLSSVVSLAAHAPIGSVAAELYKIVVQSGFERRTGEWREVVARAIIELQDRFGRLPEELEKDERFLDAVAQAAVAAMKSHRREKWDMLRNALVNSALPSSFDEDIQQILFQLIDDLTLTHVKILTLIANPQERPNEYNARVIQEPVLDYLKRRLEMTAEAEEDLRTFLEFLEIRGLLPRTRANPQGSVPLEAYTRLTPLCKRFLAFIAKPPEPPR